MPRSGSTTAYRKNGGPAGCRLCAVSQANSSGNPPAARANVPGVTDALMPT